MNIFYLDSEPGQCARFHCDKHVVKMVLETAQILCVAHHVLDGDNAIDGLYKKTHENHPSCIWARQSNNNYTWLYRLFCELAKEYKYRYDKDHKSFVKLQHVLVNLPRNIEVGYFTQPYMVMPEKYIIPNNAVASYRNFYIHDKAAFCKWKNRPIPDWFIKE